MINVSFYSNLNIVQVDNHNPPLSGTMIIIIHLDTRYDDLNLGGRAYFGGHNASAYLSIGTFSHLSCKSPYCYFWIFLFGDRQLLSSFSLPVLCNQQPLWLKKGRVLTHFQTREAGCYILFYIFRFLLVLQIFV